MSRLDQLKAEAAHILSMLRDEAEREGRLDEYFELEIRPVTWCVYMGSVTSDTYSAWITVTAAGPEDACRRAFARWLEERAMAYAELNAEDCLDGWHTAPSKRVPHGPDDGVISWRRTRSTEWYQDDGRSVTDKCPTCKAVAEQQVLASCRDQRVRDYSSEDHNALVPAAFNVQRLRHDLDGLTYNGERNDRGEDWESMWVDANPAWVLYARDVLK